MALFDWIRSDLHNLNLDWIISKIKTVEESEQGAVDAAADAKASKTAAASSATAANNSKTAAAASATAAAGSAAQAQALVDQLDTTIAQDVSDWLENNLTPTSPPVDDTLTIQGAAADAKKTGDEISDLKTKIAPLYTTENLRHAYITARENTSSFNVDVQHTMTSSKRYNITVKCDTALTSNCTIYFRNSSSGNVKSVGDFLTGETEHTFNNVYPSSDCTLIRFAKGMIGASYELIVDEIINVIDGIQADIAKNTHDISVVNEKTPVTEVMTFRTGYWRTASEFATSVQYRIGCPTPIKFNKDVYFTSLDGYALSGYRDGVLFNTQGVLSVPAGVELKLFVRRVWEDTSETADVEEWTSNIFILNYNPLTEYDLKKDTFAGLEMFRTAGFIGDSYTATRLGLSWVDIVQNETGVTCTKYAKSGADSGTWISAASYGLPALLNDTPKDLYWMALGINDGDRVDSNSAYLGSIADISGSYESYPDTFYGNTGHIIEAIQAYAPDAKIVLYKPIFTSVLRTLTGVSATQNGIKLVRDAIGEIAEHYGLPVMDALDDVLYQSPYYTNHLDSAVSAGTHPAVMLYPAIAKANMRLFSKCVQDYDTYFMDIRYD